MHIQLEFFHSVSCITLTHCYGNSYDKFLDAGVMQFIHGLHNLLATERLVRPAQF